jgi:hypothetical protein
MIVVEVGVKTECKIYGCRSILGAPKFAEKCLKKSIFFFVEDTDLPTYCSSNLRWPLRMRRRGSAMQDVEPRCDKVKR